MSQKWNQFRGPNIKRIARGRKLCWNFRRVAYKMEKVVFIKRGVAVIILLHILLMTDDGCATARNCAQENCSFFSLDLVTK